MNQILFYTIGSVIIVSLISLIGIFFWGLKSQKLQNIISILVAFAAGSLLGDAFIHLLPESFFQGNLLDPSIYILIGIIFFFILEKFIVWRHCHIQSCDEHPRVLGTMNILGDILHNFFDGIIIAGSYLVSIPLGITTTVAVILHEIPQEIGEFGVLIHSGFSRTRALWFNFFSALTAILGAVLILIFSSKSQTLALSLTQILIPFTAGGFIYIALSDLIPELHKELKLTQSLIQFLFLILGIVLMLILLKFE